MAFNEDFESCCSSIFGKRWRGHLKFYILVICLSAAVVFYYFDEHWSFVQCIYFAICTGFTVGYGNPHPTSDGSRLFTIFFIIMGIIFVFEAVNDFARFILSRIEKGVLRRHAQEDDPSSKSRTTVTTSKLKVSAVMLLLLICIGTVFFMQNEKWSLITSLYWIVCTVSTVGYGDLTLTQESSKVFLILFIPLSVTLFATSFALLSVMYRQSRTDKHREKILARPMDKYWMAHMYAEYGSLVPPEGVDKFAFVCGSLIDLGLVDLHDIEPLLVRFGDLANKSGYIHVAHDSEGVDGPFQEGDGDKDGPYGTFKVDDTLSVLLWPASTDERSRSNSVRSKESNDQSAPLLPHRN